MLGERARYTFYQPAGWESLWRRELEACFWIGKGFNNTVIAHLMGITIRAVENYINSIFSKLDIQRLNALYDGRALLVAKMLSDDRPLEQILPPEDLERLDAMAAAFLESNGETHSKLDIQRLNALSFGRALLVAKMLSDDRPLEQILPLEDLERLDAMAAAYFGIKR